MAGAVCLQSSATGSSQALGTSSASGGPSTRPPASRTRSGSWWTGLRWRGSCPRRWRCWRGPPTGCSCRRRQTPLRPLPILLCLAALSMLGHSPSHRALCFAAFSDAWRKPGHVSSGLWSESRAWLPAGRSCFRSWTATVVISARASPAWAGASPGLARRSPTRSKGGERVQRMKVYVCKVPYRIVQLR